jgi:hypothetical protein
MIDANTFLFVFGLIPMYVSIIAVAKYFTNFWTGFWNIYGLLLVSVSLGFAVYGQRDLSDLAFLVLFSFLVAFMLFFVVASGNRYGLSNIVRRAGASWVISSLSVMMFLWFNTHDTYWTGLALVGDLFLIALPSTIRPRERQRYLKSMFR